MLEPDKFARTVIWRRVMDDKSFELATLSCTGDLHRIAGVLLLAESDTPMRVDYAIDCDRNWDTRTVNVRQTLGEQIQKLVLRVEDGTWYRGDSRAPELSGCTDIDLGISPSTNLLPINRLNLQVGETREILAAWVRFPQCDVIAAPQSYERVETSIYRYRSLSSEFTALLKVDEAGFPIDYEGIWERIACTTGSKSVEAFSLNAHWH
ncbi:MAG: putative glycolipid-binding domain-containing protein [Verrucomicrobia bacterium]|nr:putative glycolipid-binding domain-containing protein [Verrucomicrobiota bacterium]